MQNTQKLYNPWISSNLENGISRKSYTSLIDDFTLIFDKESMQLFHLASQFIKTNPVTFALNSLLLLSESFAINFASLQDELIELQAEHYELLNNDYVRFWCFIQKPTIKLLATRILSLFSSIYVCEALFSALNNIKSKRRSKLTDDHLRSALICAGSNLEPAFECYRQNNNATDHID